MNITKKIWEDRYVNKGNSGFGSYQKDLYDYKLGFVRDVITQYNIKTVFDYGCGDGHVVSEIIAGRDVDSYIGIDLSPYIIEQNRKKYKDKIYYTLEEYNFDQKETFDLVISLDVIYHIMEEAFYYETLSKLFELSKKYVLIYAVDKDLLYSGHMHFRRFTNKIPNNYKLVKSEKTPNEQMETTFYLYEKIGE